VEDEHLHFCRLTSRLRRRPEPAFWPEDVGVIIKDMVLSPYCQYSQTSSTSLENTLTVDGITFWWGLLNK
jgi:hypothetical protein